MGVPLSNYTVLKLLADGAEREQENRRSFELEYALDAMENYSVFAFILHDPAVHKDFHDFFEKQFANLHYSSGKHLVFFGLVDSPKKFVLTGNQPFYTDVRDALELFEDNQLNEYDYSYSAFALANKLNIKPEMLPAIVVTHDTRLRNYRWYKTCPNQIEIQMNRLTGIANRMYLYKEVEKDLDKKQEILYSLLDDTDLDLCKGMGTTELNESMARALSDVLSFIIQEERETDYYNQEGEIIRISNKQSKITLEKAIKSFGRLQQNLKLVDLDEIGNHNLYPLIEDLNIQIGIYLALLNKKNKFEPSYISPIKKDFLDENSFHLLQTGLDVEAYLQSRNINIDYSPSAICLAKMFESEINYSIVHWFRKKYSIELPKYYNKVQPGKEVKLRAKFPSGPAGKPIDFNLEKFGNWQPPELGNSKIIAQFNLNKNEWELMGISNSTAFLSEWKKIHHVRNKAAHTSKVSLQDLYEMKKSLSKLANNNIFENLANMKNEFRNIHESH
ncbi:hypothetical protein [Neobacillus vireti]|uniref:Swt1-like HEPN domain-containing protein n=1 Tax=Neobacillus vireti LMG 21834 TaxID=1131730 RepID=A0AB94IQT5_9BACI|nr:hypothetical protein [Neobacillus vireti]ETI69450.1 hypothetical protein BAVI_07726 [Neobacillus vireti LMG 21834]KLT18916.1 hypothetical protein AA980_06185 [Neobacillus vireti]